MVKNKTRAFNKLYINHKKYFEQKWVIESKLVENWVPIIRE